MSRVRRLDLGGEVSPTGAVSFTITTHVWIWWTRIAIEQERIARDARAYALEAKPSGEGFGEALLRESHASMIAVSAAAHALDAVYGSIKSRVASGTADRRPMRILEALRSGIELRGREGGGGWAKEFEWLFDLRDAAIHFEEEDRPPVPHPAGTSGGVVSATYTVEAAGRAIDFLLEVLTMLVEKPRPALADWPESYGKSVRTLVGLRAGR